MEDWIDAHLPWWGALLAVIAILAIGWTVSIAILDDIDRMRRERGDDD